MVAFSAYLYGKIEKTATILLYFVRQRFEIMVLSGYIFLLIKSLFGYKMDRAGWPEFAINGRVTAFNTLFAKIDFMFHAPVTCFTIRMMDTVSHGKPLSLYLFYLTMV